MAWWHSGRVLDLRSVKVKVRTLNIAPLRSRSRVRILATLLSKATLGKLLTHVPLVTKQHNLVPANALRLGR